MRNTGKIRLAIEKESNTIEYVKRENSDQLLEFSTIEEAKSFLRNRNSVEDNEAYSVVRVLGTIETRPQIRTQIEFKNI
jgi:AmiR/NasT family two-component response regulator